MISAIRSFTSLYAVASLSYEQAVWQSHHRPTWLPHGFESPPKMHSPQPLPQQAPKRLADDPVYASQHSASEALHSPQAAHCVNTCGGGGDGDGGGEGDGSGDGDGGGDGGEGEQ